MLVLDPQSHRLLYILTGLVPESTGQVAQNGKVLGTVDHHGRIRTLRRHGPPLAPFTGHDRQIGQRKRMRRTLATWYDSMPFLFYLFLLTSDCRVENLKKLRLTMKMAVARVDIQMTR